MEDYKEITHRAYDDMADDFAKRDSEVIEETFEVKGSLDNFIHELPQGAHVLDIGCGGGRDSRYMFTKGLHVTGVDLSAKMIANAIKVAPEIEYLQMDFENLGFAANTFNGIWANASLHHVPKEKLPAVLTKIYNILTPNGFFFSINKHGTSDGIRENTKFGVPVRRHFSFYQPAELSEMIERAGFSIQRVTLSTSDEWVNILARK